MLTQVEQAELLAKARRPSEDALGLHRFYRGKIQSALRCAVRDLDDFAIWYTPVRERYEKNGD